MCDKRIPACFCRVRRVASTLDSRLIITQYNFRYSLQFSRHRHNRHTQSQTQSVSTNAIRRLCGGEQRVSALTYYVALARGLFPIARIENRRSSALRSFAHLLILGLHAILFIGSEY